MKAETNLKAIDASEEKRVGSNTPPVLRFSVEAMLESVGGRG